MGLIRAGQLTRQVTIRRRDSGSDALGQPVNTWSDVATVWADVRHQSGMEAIKGDARVSNVKASIRIRYRTDILAGDRVILGSVTYEVLGVMPDEQRREFTDLACEVVK
jgi:SPP1 family predicted phage head-tail adaptor